MSTITRGPWKWFGNAGSNTLYLATAHSGRRYVMDFVRWGLNSAQPRFQPPGGIMVPARDLLKFEVGDKSIVGYGSAKKDGSVYRYDVSGIDHPDARLIEEAPMVLDALKNLCVEMRHMLRVNPGKDGGLYRQRLTEAEAVIARIEPQAVLEGAA